MKPSTSSGIFTLLCTVNTGGSASQADQRRERERERIDPWVACVGITSLRGGRQVRKASACSLKKVHWVFKKAPTHRCVSAHYPPRVWRAAQLNKAANGCVSDGKIEAGKERACSLFIYVCNNNSEVPSPLVWVYSQQDAEGGDAAPKCGQTILLRDKRPKKKNV